nr:hypothetical protein [Tanacetum cinerariifolium]
MAHLVQNINHLAFRSMFEREKLSGSNSNDWFRQLKLVLRVEKKMCVIEQPIPPAPATDSAANSSPYEMLHELKSMFEKQAGVERFDLIQTFHAFKQEEGKLVSQYVLKMKGYVEQLKRLGYVLPQDLSVGLILNGLTSDFTGFVRNYNMHNMGKTIGELHVMLIEYEKCLLKKAATPQVMAIHGVLQGLRGARKLKQGDLYLYVGNGVCAQVEAIQLTPPYTSQHNGVSKRRNRTLLDMVQSMMNLTTLPLSFWDYALDAVARIFNMVPTKKVDKTPYELWFGKVPNLSYLKVRGCEALMKRDTPDKLQQRSIKCIFIGYLKETMGYYSYFPPENKIVVASEIPIEVEGFEPPHEEEAPVRRSERPHRAPNRLCLNVEVEEHSLAELNKPANYKAAMLDPESNKWLDAMNAKMQSMKDNQVWRLVDLPPNAIRILIATVAFYDYEIWKIDVKTAFLNGYLDEDIYIVQPGGFIDPKHPKKVCKLQRSIYGLKQRSWNKRFDEEIKKFGFTQNLDEPCVYQKASGSNITSLILYVDDIIVMGNHIPSLQSVKEYLGKCFAMKDLREATLILGIKIDRDRSRRLIRLSQSAYMDKILKRYRMDNSKRGYIHDVLYCKIKL